MAVLDHPKPEDCAYSTGAAGGSSEDYPDSKTMTAAI